MSQLRRTRLEIIYAGANITQDVAPDLLTFSYTDNEGGKADDIAIAVKNEDGKWSGPWIAKRGDTITATIIPEGEDAGGSLPCGTFQVDEVDDNGPPSVVTIRGTSMPTQKVVTRTKLSRAWESVKLSEIVQDIAGRGGLSPVYLIENDPMFDRRDQREETDLAFLQRICSDEGFIVKCTDVQLVVYDPRDNEKQGAIAHFDKKGGQVLQWSFSAQNHDIYYTCTVEYLDPQDGKLKSYTATQPGMSEGKDLKLVKRAVSIGEAARMAEAGLYEANRAEVTGRLTVVGNTSLVAAANITVSGFGRFDGKYFINTATHTVASAYTTTLEINNTQKALGGPSVLGGGDGLESILGE